MSLHGSKRVMYCPDEARRFAVRLKQECPEEVVEVKESRDADDVKSYVVSASEELMTATVNKIRCSQ